VLRLTRPPSDRALPEAVLGDSSQLRVGDSVIAIGNPAGLDNTVTSGIVSSLKRSSEEVGIPDKKTNFIQTDAAINPGNSGGPLCNAAGEVIGINTCIRANAEGIGFAIPITKAVPILERLSRGERIRHAYIGVQMSSLTPDLARQHNEDPNAGATLPGVRGALVVRVLPRSPAASAGLRRFDVVVAIGGGGVETAGDAQGRVDESEVGRKVLVTVVRNGREIELGVVPEDLAALREKKKT
jgi:S1-C subfamily serine protease